MPVKMKHMKIMDNGVVHYDSGMRAWSKAEVDEINNQYFEDSKAYIQQALEDGYIEFPIMWENGKDNVIWSACYLPPTFMPSHAEGFKERFGMNYNIYIPSYKRAGIALTNVMLDYFGIENYYFCVDPDQYPAYKEAYGMDKVIIRDHTFKQDHKTNKMSSINSPHYLVAGSAFMNALLYMTKALGDDRYWMLDDDIRSVGLKAPRREVDVQAKDWKYDKDDFYRASTLLRPEIDFDLKEFMRDLEEFSMLGRNQGSVTIDKYGLTFDKPINFMLGTRAYSFFLANTKSQPDERGFQNNDTINSIDENRSGYIVSLLRGYQYDSLDSQVMPGGCTGAYTTFGTLDKGKSLVSACPNVSKISFLYSRIHHTVDYNHFTKRRLVGVEKK